MRTCARAHPHPYSPTHTRVHTYAQTRTHTHTRARTCRRKHTHTRPRTHTQPGGEPACQCGAVAAPDADGAVAGGVLAGGHVHRPPGPEPLHRHPKEVCVCVCLCLWSCSCVCVCMCVPGRACLCMRTYVSGGHARACIVPMHTLEIAACMQMRQGLCHPSSTRSVSHAKDPWM